MNKATDKAGIWGSYPKGRPEHPYKRFEKSDVWLVVKKSLEDLEANQDLVLRERHEYVVGYICKQIANAESKKKRTSDRSGRSRATKRSAT